jgi:hypothetical protein
MPSIRVPVLSPICGLQGPSKKTIEHRDDFQVVCRRCGKFVIMLELSCELEINPLTRQRSLTPDDEYLLRYLPAYTRQMDNSGIVPELDTSNWRDFARAHATTSVTGKLSKLLEFVSTHSSRSGDRVQIDTELDYPLFDSNSPEEITELLDHLVSRGHLRRPTTHNDSRGYSLTIEGREYLDRATKSANDPAQTVPVVLTREFCFVKDPELRKILERDYQEIQRAYNARCWKSVIIISGGAIEAILTDLLLQNESRAKAVTKAPKQPDLTRWDLSDLINVSVELGLASHAIEKLSHSVREYRNLVHPGNEIRNKLTFDAEEAKIALEVLHIVHRELS